MSHVPPLIEPDIEDGDLSSATGRVRGVVIGEASRGGEYARIRLAGSSFYWFDFDDPEAWESLRGRAVRILFDESRNADGLTYWRVLAVEELDA